MSDVKQGNEQCEDKNNFESRNKDEGHTYNEGMSIQEWSMGKLDTKPLPDEPWIPDVPWVEETRKPTYLDFNMTGDPNYKRTKIRFEDYNSPGDDPHLWKKVLQNLDLMLENMGLTEETADAWWLKETVLRNIEENPSPVKYCDYNGKLLHPTRGPEPEWKVADWAKHICTEEELRKIDEENETSETTDQSSPDIPNDSKPLETSVSKNTDSTSNIFRHNNLQVPDGVSNSSTSNVDIIMSSQSGLSNGSVHNVDNKDTEIQQYETIIKQNQSRLENLREIPTTEEKDNSTITKLESEIPSTIGYERLDRLQETDQFPKYVQPPKEAERFGISKEGITKHLRSFNDRNKLVELNTSKIEYEENLNEPMHNIRKRKQNYKLSQHFNTFLSFGIPRKNPQSKLKEEERGESHYWRDVDKAEEGLKPKSDKKESTEYENPITQEFRIQLSGQPKKEQVSDAPIELSTMRKENSKDPQLNDAPSLHEGEVIESSFKCTESVRKFIADIWKKHQKEYDYLGSENPFAAEPPDPQFLLEHYGSREHSIQSQKPQNPTTQKYLKTQTETGLSNGSGLKQRQNTASITQMSYDTQAENKHWNLAQQQKNGSLQIGNGFRENTDTRRNNHQNKMSAKSDFHQPERYEKTIIYPPNAERLWSSKEALQLETAGTLFANEEIKTKELQNAKTSAISNSYSVPQQYASEYCQPSFNNYYPTTKRTMNSRQLYSNGHKESIYNPPLKEQCYDETNRMYRPFEEKPLQQNTVFSVSQFSPQSLYSITSGRYNSSTVINKHDSRNPTARIGEPIYEQYPRTFGPSFTPKAPRTNPSNNQFSGSYQPFYVFSKPESPQNNPFNSKNGDSVNYGFDRFGQSRMPQSEYSNKPYSQSTWVSGEFKSLDEPNEASQRKNEHYSFYPNNEKRFDTSSYKSRNGLSRYQNTNLQESLTSPNAVTSKVPLNEFDKHSYRKSGAQSNRIYQRYGENEILNESNATSYGNPRMSNGFDPNTHWATRLPSRIYNSGNNNATFSPTNNTTYSNEFPSRQIKTSPLNQPFVESGSYNRKSHIEPSSSVYDAEYNWSLDPK